MAPRSLRSIDWKAQFSLNLKAKFAVVAGVMILCVAVIVTAFLTRQQERTIRDELVRRALALTETLAYNCQLPLVTENQVSLDRLGAGMLSEKEIGYVEFRNTQGVLLSRAGEVDPDSLAADAPLADQERGIRSAWLRGRGDLQFLDVLAQVTLADASEDDILSSHQRADASVVLGSVRVGMTTAFAEARIAAMRSLATQVGIVIALAGSLVAAVVIGWMTRPLSRLMEGNARVARGDFSLRVQVRSADEFGRLASSYNQMADEIERSRELANRYLESLRKSAEELEEANKALRQNNAEITKASRMKSEFLAVMSHELRTPLNGIIGFSEVLLDEKFGKVNEKQRRFLENTLKSGRHLLTLINDILDLSKVESGRMEITPEEFDLRQCIDDVQTMVRNLAAKKSIELACPHVPRVTPHTDPKLLRQILLNLLSNAIKFTTEGGKVELVIRTMHGRQLRSEPISRAMHPGGRDAVPNEDVLVVEVSDTGVGIAPEDYARIFTAFEQLDTAYSRQQEGTGLGLALTRRIVRLLRGDIWFTSRQNEGTRFMFYVPLDFNAGEREEVTRQAFSAADWNTATAVAPRRAARARAAAKRRPVQAPAEPVPAAAWPWGEGSDAPASSPTGTQPRLSQPQLSATGDDT